MTDRELIQSFLETRSEQAFGQLVTRYLDLVYASARRQVRDGHAAEDVAQIVFVLLAQKARSIRNRQTIAGWLLVTTRRVALNQIRSDSRRRRHESESAHMRSEITPPHDHEAAADWGAIQSALDEAVTSLDDDDRDAVTLRFFQKRSFEDVAGVLGISSEAARKRVGRAIVKLRSALAERGVTAPAESLSAMLLAGELTTSAPAHLFAQIADAALSPTALTGTMGLTKGAILMATMKANPVALVTVIALLAVAAPIGYLAYSNSTAQVPAAAARQAGGNTSSAAEKGVIDPISDFESAYSLQSGQSVRRIVPPYVVSRKDYILQSNPFDRDGKQETILAHWTDDGLQYRGGGDAPLDVRSALLLICDIWPQETDIPRNILATRVPGDWVIDQDASKEDKLRDACAALSDALGAGMILKQEPLLRPVIVVRGTLKEDATDLHLYTDVLPDPSADIGMNSESADRTLHWTGQILGRQVIVEADLGRAKRQMIIRAHGSINPEKHQQALDTATTRKVLDNLSKETGLVFTLEERIVPTWRLMKSQP